MSSAHFYSPVTGALIDGGLREARKVQGLPSPTTVLSLIKGEGLLQYFRRCMYEASFTTPRYPGMTDQDHYDACVLWADQHSKRAREKGGDFHSLVQAFHLSCIGEAKPPYVPNHFIEMYDAYLRWYETYVDRTLAVEAAVIGAGYAGRLDHCALLKDGRVAVLDTKTQALNEKKRNFSYYLEWALQLGAYAGALEPIQHVDVIVSVVVSSSLPTVLEAHYWPKPVDHYTDLFLGLLRVWSEANNYWPEPVAVRQLLEPKIVPLSQSP